MKKILFALVAIALVAVSCKPKDNPEDPQNPDEPVVPEFTLTMAVQGTPTATTADVKCTPSADDVYYYVAYAEAAAGDLTAADFYEFANGNIAMYIQYGYTIDDVANMGEQTISFDGLTPETTYRAYAGQVDEDGTEFEDIFTCDFTTAAMAQSSMTIAIAFDDPTNSVTFTPSASDAYGMYIETRADFDEYWESFDAENWANELSDWAYTYAYYGLEFPTYNAAQTVDLTQFFSETVPAGTALIAIAAPMQSGIVNGTANGIEFTPTTDIVVADSDKAAAKMRRAQKSVFRMAR